jgi:putative (di)nucleoside polyphosphate hydrolase
MPKTIFQEMHRQDGYRPNVGIILVNRFNQVLWARRAGHDGWQFPQGGVRQNETPDQALYRELYEEVGLGHEHVEIVARTRDWLRYDLPEPYLQRIRRRGDNNFRGQKQLWYLLHLTASDSKVCLDASGKPEFDKWIWLDWWNALEQIVEFKREVYEVAMKELVRHLPRNAFFPRLFP